MTIVCYVIGVYYRNCCLRLWSTFRYCMRSNVFRAVTENKKVGCLPMSMKSPFMRLFSMRRNLTWWMFVPQAPEQGMSTTGGSPHRTGQCIDEDLHWFLWCIGHPFSLWIHLYPGATSSYYISWYPFLSINPLVGPPTSIEYIVLTQACCARMLKQMPRIPDLIYTFLVGPEQWWGYISPGLHTWVSVIRQQSWLMQARLPLK